MGHDQATTKIVELLEKILAVQLYSSGMTQGRIAHAVGKSKTWVNDLLKGMPRKKEQA